MNICVANGGQYSRVVICLLLNASFDEEAIDGGESDLRLCMGIYRPAEDELGEYDEDGVESAEETGRTMSIEYVFISNKLIVSLIDAERARSISDNVLQRQ